MRWPVVVLLLGGAASACASEAVMFRADARHSGVYPGSGVPELHGLKWSFRAGGPIVSSPVVADGTVYFGSADHQVYALAEHSGELRWKFATGGRVSASPAVAEGRLFVGSYDGNFYALDAATGALAWKFATAGERRFSARHLHGAEPAAEVMPDPFDVFLSSPVVAGGTVYFGSGDGNVYALSTATGALRWKFHTGNVVHASPALAGGLLYVGSWDSYFYALDAESGAERWRFKTGEDPAIGNQVGIQSSAAVAAGIVYFGCRDSNLYALDAASGQQRWAFSTKGSWVVTSPAVKDGVVYFATSDSATVHALDAASGAPRQVWNFPHWPFFSSPALAGERLYIGSHAGKLLVLNLKDQSIAWTFATEGARQNAAALTTAQGAPDYAAVFGDFFYDDMVSGVKRMLGVGAVLSSPVIEGDTVYFGSWDGQLYALG
ncbi:MAG: PQQ-binding-like beta-propeller repeat protein [Proteobacteria bacterium]|nr:PQQ-binding-like beta-propeller repeat protein [Pseudomonadota bacterium]